MRFFNKIEEILACFIIFLILYFVSEYYFYVIFKLVVIAVLPLIPIILIAKVIPNKSVTGLIGSIIAICYYTFVIYHIISATNSGVQFDHLSDYVIEKFLLIIHPHFHL